MTPEIADSLGLDDAKGALVAEAQTDSPAAAAGLKSGDTILAVNGKDVDGPRELAAMIADMEPGTTVKVTYWRDGEKHDVDVKLGTLPGERPDGRARPARAGGNRPSALEDFGMAVAPAEDASRRDGDRCRSRTARPPSGASSPATSSSRSATTR